MNVLHTYIHKYIHVHKHTDPGELGSSHDDGGRCGDVDEGGTARVCIYTYVYVCIRL